VVAAREGALNVRTLVVVQAERLRTETHSSNPHVLARTMMPPMWNNDEAVSILNDLSELGRDRPSRGGSPDGTTDHPTCTPPRVLCWPLLYIERKDYPKKAAVPLCPYFASNTPASVNQALREGTCGQRQ